MREEVSRIQIRRIAEHTLHNVFLNPEKEYILLENGANNILKMEIHIMTLKCLRNLLQRSIVKISLMKMVQVNAISMITYHDIVLSV